MKPALVVFQLGEQTIALPSYGLAVMLGFALATLLAVRQAGRAGLPRAEVADLAFWMLLAGVAGSRLLFVLLNARHFVGTCAGSGLPRSARRLASDCLAAFALWDGGLVFFGGLVVAGAVAAGFVRRRGWRFGTVGDLFAPGLALGQAVGRLGCFGAGCCFGQTCAAAGLPCVSFPAASVAHSHLVAFSHLPAAAAFTPPLHPTQLYESLALLGIFFLLVTWRPRQRFHGQIFLLYLATYGFARFAVELFRGDVSRRFLFELRAPTLARALDLPPAAPLLLSTSQAAGLLLGVTAAAVLAFAWRTRSRTPPGNALQVRRDAEPKR
jgi:phosphatidylglycerol:prolipoprotein diacylglycerol transferase